MKAVVTDKWILCPVCRAKTQSRNEMFFACVFCIYEVYRCAEVN